MTTTLARIDRPSPLATAMLSRGYMPAISKKIWGYLQEKWNAKAAATCKWILSISRDGFIESMTVYHMCMAVKPFPILKAPKYQPIAVLEHCKYLQKLSLQEIVGVRFDRAFFAKLGSCPLQNVKHLALTTFFVEDVEVMDLSKLMVACTTLTKLDLDLDRIPSEGHMAMIAATCSELATLRIQYYPNIGSFPVCDFCPSAIGGLHALRELRLDEHWTYSSEGWGEITAGCQGLETVLAYGVTDAVLDGMTAQCKNLKRLFFFQSPGITDAGVATLATRCTALEELFLDGVAVKATREHADALGKLPKLYIAHINNQKLLSRVG